MKDNPVLISIDTEGPTGSDPVKHMIYGEVSDGTRYGIDMLMDVFDKYQVKGIFFVDMAEAWDYGKEKILGVVSHIKERGHDVGVHIHPDHMADRNRRYLWEYTFDEQKEIIGKCTELYQENFHEHPLYFRAGRYGADNNTLDIISSLGYRYDFSEFYSHKGCHIIPEITCNKVVKYKEVVEIPVSSYKSFNKFGYSRFDKLDISMPQREFIQVADLMRRDDSVDIISFFLHSFSLLEWRKQVDSPALIEPELKKLENILEYMKNKNYKFISAANLDNYAKPFDGPIVPTDYSRMKGSAFYFMHRALEVVKMRLENNI